MNYISILFGNSFENIVIVILNFIRPYYRTKKVYLYLKIKNVSIARFIEGIIRVIIIYTFFKYFGLKILPISSFVLTAVFQYLYVTYLVSKANKWNLKKELIQSFAFLLFPITIILSTFVLPIGTVLWLTTISAIIIVFSIILKNRKEIRNIIILRNE